MGSKSSSSSSTSTYTNTQDQRVAAADNGVAIGAGGWADLSTVIGGGIDASSTTVTNVTDGGAFEFAQAFAEEMGRLGRTSVEASRDVSKRGLDVAAGVSDDAFDLSNAALAGMLAGLEVVDSGAKANAQAAFGFAEDTLAGYAKHTLDESERKFNQAMTAVMVLGVVGLIAWAYVKG